VFAGPLFRRRLDADYLSRVDEYRADFGKVLLGDLGRSGSFFTGD
jgi:hypothetical protein